MSKIFVHGHVPSIRNWSVSEKSESGSGFREIENSKQMKNGNFRNFVFFLGHSFEGRFCCKSLASSGKRTQFSLFLTVFFVRSKDLDWRNLRNSRNRALGYHLLQLHHLLPINIPKKNTADSTALAGYIYAGWTFRCIVCICVLNC